MGLRPKPPRIHFALQVREIGLSGAFASRGPHLGLIGTVCNCSALPRCATRTIFARLLQFHFAPTANTYVAFNQLR